MYNLVGGKIEKENDGLNEAYRELEEETNIKKDDMDLIHFMNLTYIKWDKELEVYYGILNKDVTLIEEKDDLVEITLDNGEELITFKIKKTLKEKTTDRYQFSVVENEKIAFDHPIVILSGLMRIRNKISYTDIVFNMMPEYFTLGELQQVYEVILNKKLLDPAFRRIIADKVVKTKKMRTGGGHRPSYLFKYKGN